MGERGQTKNAVDEYQNQGWANDAARGTSFEGPRINPPQKKKNRNSDFNLLFQIRIVFYLVVHQKF